ncbi:sugar phosphate isomerase/epimerase family protein [Methanomethylovorans sp.]|uniref:sugar phosphate isomerase/epimerase family protein n=1 Tax=Methanomethylovorans sp. TaxID=2758717 RepID=UPI00351BF7BB
MIIGASSFAGSLSELSHEVRSVELYIPKLHVYKGPKLDREILSKILDELSTLDLMTSIHAPYSAESPTYPKDLQVDTSNMVSEDFRLMGESMELAASLGSKAVVLHPGRINGDREVSFQNMISNLKELAAQATDCGVMLGLENKEGTDPTNLCCRAEELVAAVEAVNSDNLKITLDIGHANLTCGGDPYKLRAFVRTVAPYVVHMHMHDNGGKWTSNYDGDEHLAPGKGTVDYTVLKEIHNYRGIYNLEVFSMPDVLTGKSTLLKYLDRS